MYLALCLMFSWRMNRPVSHGSSARAKLAMQDCLKFIGRPGISDFGSNPAQNNVRGIILEIRSI